ncbi:MAG: glycosyltransferase [Candidatus Saccharimonadales bacterium]
MKILIAADLHWPTINGVATFSRNLAKGLSDRGHEVLVVAPSQTGRGYEEYDGNYLIKRTRSVSFPFYQNFKISPTPQIEVRKIIREFQPDVIHIQMAMFLGLAARTYALKYNIPLVATNHAMPENLMDNIRLLAPISKPIQYLMVEYGARFHAKADYITLPTKSAIDMFGEERVGSVPVEPVSNGIDLSKFQPGQPSADIYHKFGLPKNKDIITYIGRLDAEKHVPVLIDAFRQIMNSKRHLLIVGDGTDAEHLRNIVLSTGIADSVTFTGRVSDEEIIELHKVGMLFCVPSPAELQCIALLEAMASGKPAVAVDAGALGELCQTGVNGILCEKDDAKAIAHALETILNSKALQQQYGKASLEIAATHDIVHTLDRFEEIYEQVVTLKTPVLPQQLL